MLIMKSSLLYILSIHRHLLFATNRQRVIYTIKRMSTFPGFATNALHVGQEPEQWDMNQVVPNISLSSTYKQDIPGMPKVHSYSRGGNPTRDVLQKNIASLEGAKYCHVFSSGMASSMVVFNLLNVGDHIVCSNDIYGGIQRYLRRVSIPHHGLSVTFADLTIEEEIEKAFKPNTKMVWFESPTNPLLKVIDISAIVYAARAHNPNIIVVTDNTFMSPYFQRPLSMGVDMVVHSVSKFINGHSDVIMGAAITDREDLHEHLLMNQRAGGAVPSPFDCYLVNRGIKTLHLRMKAHDENGLAVARFLESSDRVKQVIYPALPSHPENGVHKKQAKGMSGIISFYIKGGLEESTKFLSSLKIFTLAESVGGYESLAELPSLMSHASVPIEEREKIGITDNLIRLSTGIEDVDDLIADLEQALKWAIPNVHDAIDEDQYDEFVSKKKESDRESSVKKG